MTKRKKPSTPNRLSSRWKTVKDFDPMQIEKEPDPGTNPSFCKSLLIFGSGCGLGTKYSLSLRKSVSTRTSPVFFGWMNVPALHWEWPIRFQIPSVSNRSISFQVVASYACGIEWFSIIRFGSFFEF